jgi:hypothetical protein
MVTASIKVFKRGQGLQTLLQHCIQTPMVFLRFQIQAFSTLKIMTP